MQHQQEALKPNDTFKSLTSKFKGLGLTGLANLGNTCFMNSALQCLSHTYELNLFLDSEKYKTRLNDKPESLILCEWDKLRKLMWSENCTISPGGFLGSVQKLAQIKGRDIFTGFAQNDLTEFLQFIIDCFHSGIYREVNMNITGQSITETDKLAEDCFKMMKNMYKKEYSEFLSMFYGIHVSSIKSLESDYTNNSPEPFFNLTLPIGKKKTLIGCFEEYTKVEKMEKEDENNDNRIFNDETKKKENANKQITFWNFPDILVITLKRFGNNIRKNQEYIEFPLDNLNLSKYVVGYDNKSYIYDLYGICNHSGNVMGGHYTAFIKNADDNWYHCNDTIIQKIGNLDTLKTPKAYCFFYRKQKK
jgi:ubiquitin C-terminal hydrolase